MQILATECCSSTVANAYTKEFFETLFEYREGVLYWKSRPEDHFQTKRRCQGWNDRFAGKLAGSLDNWGYWIISFTYKGRSHKIKRAVVVLAMWGRKAQKDMVIDHINGTKTDDRIENLRITTQLNNARNTKLPCTNKTGCKGVRFHNGKWEAHLTIEKQWVHLGRFLTYEEAFQFRKAKEVEVFGEYRRREAGEQPPDPFPYEPTPEEEVWLNSIGSL